MNYFLTKDLYLAAYLVSSGCELSSHTQTNGITMFAFPRTARLEELTQLYFSPKATVNPLQYDSAIKSLRYMTIGPKHRTESTFSGKVPAKV